MVESVKSSVNHMVQNLILRQKKQSRHNVNNLIKLVNTAGDETKQHISDGEVGGGFRIITVEEQPGEIEMLHDSSLQQSKNETN